MLRQFLLWLAAVLVLYAIWVFQKGNVGWLFWGMIAWWIVGTAWQVIRARKSQQVDAGTPSTPVPHDERNQFDSEFCGRIIRIAAICFGVMAIFELVLFLSVESTKCPGWQTPAEKNGGSVWAIWAFATVWALYISYRAMTWSRFSRTIVDQIEWARRTYIPGTNPTWLTDWTQFTAMCTVKNNMNGLLVVVLIGSGLFVALPVLTRINCF